MNLATSILCSCWLLIALAACGPRTGDPAAQGDASRSANSAQANPGLQDATAKALIGKWARTDGDYMLDISAVEDGGKLAAAYFNPTPIQVSKALLVREATGLKVFIELQDVGYPGCTYSLKLDESTQQLYGQYFQAAQQQTYDVVFARLKE